MRPARLLWIAFWGVLLVIGVQALVVFRPTGGGDLPWTTLDLRAPVGGFTAAKLGALARDPDRCVALLRRADIVFATLPARRDGACGWDSAVRLTAAPDPHVPLSCPLAAAFEVWMRQVVQPAAASLLGARVVQVEHFGSYACRRIDGRPDGAWSEHAFANAIDVSGFRMGDGRRVTVARDWRRGARGIFLHQVRDGACRLFATTLSPDYNAAHRDHLHLDEAAAGEVGWRICR